ncbi:MAG: DUF998 domain-containing protein [Actinomycetota bacterium]|nr:DUF998 domain-containing protein [Actinomycetota bacterium]
MIGPTSVATTKTRTLLVGGGVAGPLFVVVAVVQAFARAGFDVRRHPLSLLSLGDLGWIQISNFVVAGMLFVGCAVGMRRVLGPGRGGTWGPRFIGVFGVSLIAGGIFVADPAFGFPPGTPEGMPDRLSWHGIVHAVAPVVGFLSLIAATFALARVFASLRQRGWAAYSAATGVVVLALSAWPSTENFLPLWVATVLGFGWASAIAARLHQQHPRDTSAETT